ncbi:MAG: 50S ribosomal protein L24e [Thermoplasmata archaeon]
MPVSRTCTFCGNDIEPGTGKMYVRRDGNVHFFCSGKCQKNQLDLGRVGRKVRWTRRYVRAAQQQAPRVTAAPEAVVVEETTEEAAAPVEEVALAEPMEEEEAPSEDREDVIKAFSDLPGVGPATSAALWEAGFTSVAKLEGASEEELTEIKGLGPASVKKILAHLKEGT